jgi:alkylation response protein AidB-like acyl-CoA dehydrogenase
MALSRLPADHEEVSSHSLKEAVMGLEAGPGEALRTDYFMLREEFTPAQLDYLERTRGFVHEEVLPVINGYWERAEFPWPLIKKLGAAGLVGDGIQGYGCPDMDPLAAGLVTMELHRDGDSYVIDGRKKWIGNGTIADVVVVWARDTTDRQVKGFLVEKGTPGFTARLIEGKGSLRAVWQASIELDAVRVPASGKLPGAQSFRDTAAVLASTRATCAWAALGHAVAGFDAALSYAKRRTQFGQPLVSFQLIQDRLVTMLARVTAMQLYCRRLADLAMAGRVEPTLAGLAKSHNTTAAREVLAEARDLLGGNGILLDFHVIRHMADIEAIHTFEGTATIQNLIVGRDITGVSAFTAGA